MKHLLPLLLFSMSLFYSCAEDEPDCMKCYSEVTDLETSNKTKGGAATYCDEKLDAILSKKPIELDGTRSEWVCE